MTDDKVVLIPVDVSECMTLVFIDPPTVRAAVAEWSVVGVCEHEHVDGPFSLCTPCKQSIEQDVEHQTCRRCRKSDRPHVCQARLTFTNITGAHDG